MNVFDIHHTILEGYAQYVDSFLNIADERIREFVQSEIFDRHSLWPEALLQLNPAYLRGHTVEQLVQQGRLHPECSTIFRTPMGDSLRLYRHQEEALERANENRPYVVTSGTGSGKSLTYFLPIFDAILRGGPQAQKVWAIVVYPMNALVNSQEDALRSLGEAYRQRTGHNMPVRFAKYTGQESSAQKQEIQQHPPHILLTNYVMLEMMLVRPQEAQFVASGQSTLQFIVMDELHTYRGRQGADVALLLRRLRERSGNPSLRCVGTSATMATVGSRAERRTVVADFASRFFGTHVEPENIIEEKLERIIPLSAPSTVEALREAVVSQPPLEQWPEFASNPLSAWIENTFGLAEDEDGHLYRPRPITLAEGGKRLAMLTGLELEKCVERLRDMLLIGSKVSYGDTTAFAFKLHQFVTQGDAVYATLEPRERRLLTLEGQVFAPGKSERLLYPLTFCRICGQEYYVVRFAQSGQHLLPGTEQFDVALDNDEVGTFIPGYAMLDPEGTWSDSVDDLPDHWLEPSNRLKREYQPFRPRLLSATPAGSITTDTPSALRVWFQPAPFMLCTRCGEAYTRRDTNDFRKLARLSSEGRSTATTLLSLSTVGSMRHSDTEPTAQKILSFTDNRQDASLQAGHFNDFVQVALLRAALARAVTKAQQLRFDTIAARVVDELAINLRDYVRGSNDGAPLDPNSQQGQRAIEAFSSLVEYRLYEDLRRGWRIVQPNLEQCGLLRIDYAGLMELASDDVAWQGTAWLAQLLPEERAEVLTTVLDEMRRQSTIDIPILRDRNEQERLRRRVFDYLNEQWAFDEDEKLRYASMYILPAGRQAPGDYSLSERSVIGRWLRYRIRQRFGIQLDRHEYEQLIRSLVGLLCQKGLLIEQTEGTGTWNRTGFRLRPSAMIWLPGDGIPAANPLRRYRVNSESYLNVTPEANTFFQHFYWNALEMLKDMESGAHTAQVNHELRQKREVLFRNGELEALFCSPTMELGIDIRDLNAVHMRNVPPTPANYAQRSGRAGRAGQPALVLTYCSSGSGHDQYYFRHRSDMVAGAVAAPTLELANQDLLRAHLHAIWLAKTGLNLARDNGSILHVVDPGQEGYPLHDVIRAQIAISPAQLTACVEEAQHVIEACNLDARLADWLHEGWIVDTIQQAAHMFDHAFDRWRELFRLAFSQLQRAQRLQTQMFLGPRNDDGENADALVREAQRQLQLLTCQNVRTDETDFYAYRYLANEGFLPGYNFPALPVRAYIQRAGEGEFIARPRYLALSEFGPESTIYHEGAKYQVHKVWLPSQDPESRFLRAKACNACGYFHAGDTAYNSDICQNCGASLTTDNAEVLVNLLELPTVSTRRRNRITCDEEERLRQGYDITAHFRFARREDQQLRHRRADVMPPSTEAIDERLLQLDFAPAATLWWVNHRWKRREEAGYRLNLATGEWLGTTQDAGERPADVRNQVHLFVRDTANILLVYPCAQDQPVTEPFLATLQHALAHGIQKTFQVEASELASERIGEGERRGILFWEAAEGGLGVLRRLVDEPGALAQVAGIALDVLHFDPDGADRRPPEDEMDGCARACYTCLLSYFNQRDHAILDRHLVVEFLRRLVDCVTRTGGGARDYEAHYQWLRSRTDTRSNLERKFVDHLYQTGRRMPDDTQRAIQIARTVPDFFYEPSICVYCDGSVHDEAQQMDSDAQTRRYLRERGYHVIVIRYDQDMESQIQQHSYIFGERQR